MSLLKEGQQEPDLDMQDEQEGKAVASVLFCAATRGNSHKNCDFTHALFSQALECCTLPEIQFSLSPTCALSLVF